MSTIAESATYDAAVFQIDTTTPLLGGEDGPLNKAAKNLANRTAYLKAKQESTANEVAAARGGKASLSDRISSLEKTTAQGDFTFAGTAGATISHSLGNMNYTVNVVSTAATNGGLGDVYVARSANTFTIYNTGGYTGTARYQIMN